MDRLAVEGDNGLVQVLGLLLDPPDGGHDEFIGLFGVDLAEGSVELGAASLLVGEEQLTSLVTSLHKV